MKNNQVPGLLNFSGTEIKNTDKVLQIKNKCVILHLVSDKVAKKQCFKHLTFPM